MGIAQQKKKEKSERMMIQSTCKIYKPRKNHKPPESIEMSGGRMDTMSYSECLTPYRLLWYVNIAHVTPI